jgi:choline/glycine/proline betaine transport protein
VVFPAMQSFAEELNGHGIRTQIGDHIAEEGILRLEVAHGEEIDFVYQVNLRGHPLPDQSLSGKSLEDMKQDQIFYRAEVHLIEGGQDYDIMGWSQEQVVLDMLNQYETHLQFLHTVR